MSKVPQQYYSTCAWVRHYYAQADGFTASTAPSRDKVWPVYTLPIKEPNPSFVLERFPLAANGKHPSTKERESAHSAAQPQCSEVIGDTLENRYNRLLARITNDIANSDATQ
ncbi:hypothetical protein JKF63_00323 [Porcisia hertigi]|uniref:Uncharacterized protein n=1 Tax=Porcisia hertigi TaxID=2761500 RepID=A0A836KX15_9TRYP|nr:hypothetical protein JKF63_00323 [Porcisia hertigi]